MSDLLVVLFACIIFILICAVIYLTLNIRKLSKSFEDVSVLVASNDILVSELKNILEDKSELLTKVQQQTEKCQLEYRQISQQLEHRIKNLKDQQIHIKHQIDDVASQQPEDKLYSRAQKLVKLGADIDEVMRECQLPRAEVEILYALQKGKN